MRDLKIAVIGAGSTYTPELINGFITRKCQLSIKSLYLMDIDMHKLEIVAGLAERMLKTNDMKADMVLTSDLDEAIKDADYVLCQIRVGGLDSRIKDEKIPLKYYLLGQETTGAGGFMKAMRTIPVMMNVAKTMEKLAPNAWMINFSNPSGIIAQTILSHTNIKMIGLCNGPINMIKRAKDRVPENSTFDYEFVGLNHLCWITKVLADGNDVLTEQLEYNNDISDLKNIPKMPYEPAIMKATKGIPIGYLNYYYNRYEMIQKCKDAEKTRGEVCKDIEAELLELYKDENICEKPAVLDKRGGALYSEAAVSLIDAIENDKNEIHVVDVLNQGSYSFMDDNDVVETKCLINKNGAQPIKLTDFENQYIIGLMRAVKAYENLAVKAGIDGDYDAALAALMVHPLIGDFKKAKSVLDEMLQANEEHLPQFFKEGSING